jgi:hypothetical protein
VRKLRSVCEILRATNLETCTLGRANDKGSGKGDYQFERTVLKFKPFGYIMNEDFTALPFFQEDCCRGPQHRPRSLPNNQLDGLSTRSWWSILDDYSAWARGMLSSMQAGAGGFR